MNTEKKECEKCDGKGYPYQDDNIDCDECYGTGKEQLTNTEKREKELMKEEKRYYADIKITWGVSFHARNKKEAIEYLKEQYKDDYGIDLNDSEITKLEEDK